MTLRLASTSALRATADKSLARSNARTLYVAITTIAFVLSGSSSVFACPMCFGAEETSMVDATRLGILVMLGIVLAVQAGFVAFFFYLRSRAKRAAELEIDLEWSELQRAPRA